MKKILFSFAGVLALTFGANSQLRVLSNGHVQLGDWNAQPLSGPLSNSQQFSTDAVINPGVTPAYQVNDTTTTIAVLGNNSSNFSGGSIAFGGRKDVMVQEESFTKGLTRPYGVLSLTGLGGIRYSSSAGTIFSHTPSRSSSTSEVFTFGIDVKATKFLTSSDARYKKNIESLESMGGLLDGLTPVSYNLDIPMKDESGMAQKASANTVSDRRSFGFIAQEVREIFPELVYEDSEGTLSLDYQGFIPLLVDAYKELNAKVADQEKTIATLTETNRKLKGTASINDIESEEAIVLMQNRPNPFKDTTEIRCHLPEVVSDAFICIYDLNGRQQMRLNISDRGNVAVTVSGSSLQPGIYIYSLIADGQEADTRRMILTE
ncbi:MAG: tail fiber domain-containing protein [Muribaculaceae bacterium]|nr:tail fiber domain-containing protein [Muribaculaceae bacterium]